MDHACVAFVELRLPYNIDHTQLQRDLTAQINERWVKGAEAVLLMIVPQVRMPCDTRCGMCRAEFHAGASKQCLACGSDEVERINAP